MNTNKWYTENERQIKEQFRQIKHIRNMFQQVRKENLVLFYTVLERSVYQYGVPRLFLLTQIDVDTANRIANNITMCYKSYSNVIEIFEQALYDVEPLIRYKDKLSARHCEIIDICSKYGQGSDSFNKMEEWINQNSIDAQIMEIIEDWREKDKSCYEEALRLLTLARNVKSDTEFKSKLQSYSGDNKGLIYQPDLFCERRSVIRKVAYDILKIREIFKETIPDYCYNTTDNAKNRYDYEKAYKYVQEQYGVKCLARLMYDDKFEYNPMNFFDDEKKLMKQYGLDKTDINLIACLKNADSLPEVYYTMIEVIPEDAPHKNLLECSKRYSRGSYSYVTKLLQIERVTDEELKMLVRDWYNNLDGKEILDDNVKELSNDKVLEETTINKHIIPWCKEFREILDLYKIPYEDNDCVTKIQPITLKGLTEREAALLDIILKVR